MTSEQEKSPPVSTYSFRAIRTLRCELGNHLTTCALMLDPAKNSGIVFACRSCLRRVLKEQGK